MSDKLAEEYKNFYCSYYGIDSSHRNAISTIDKIQSYLKNSDSKILEYGCATGFNLRYLFRKGYTNLWGLDAHNPFVAEGILMNNKDNGYYHDIQLRSHNLSQDPMESLEWTGFDYIFTRGVLQQGKTRREKIKNNDSEVDIILVRLKDMLKPTGKMFLSEGPVRNWEHLSVPLVRENGLYMFRGTK